MSVLISKDKRELVVNCNCGCDDTVHVYIDDEDKDDFYALVTYLNGNWSRDQGEGAINSLKRKMSKIWSIIRNRDYYYSDILMNKNDFEQFKEYINQF